MNRRHRTRPLRPLRGYAALPLAALLLTACGGEADQPAATPSEAPSATPTEPAATKPAGKPSKKASEEPAGVTSAVTIEGGSVEPLAQSVEAEVGQKVELRITSDRAGELHVHATPEQYHDFGSGRSTVTMTFDKPGAVDVEEHESGALLLRVLVR